MGYLHIDNLYKNQDVLLFRELYALEKLHGTSAHIGFVTDKSTKFDMGTKEQHAVVETAEGLFEVFSGGTTLNNFYKLFDVNTLPKKLAELGVAEIAIHGELYGGNQQKQAWRYGKELKFCVFDIKIHGSWLSVPKAEELAKTLGFEFVSWTKIPGTVEACNAARDAPSVQAKRNGVEGDQPMEGVILRPLMELTDNRGQRIIAKHKRAEERETATERKVEDASKTKVMADAAAIANEWVTETRLDHVLDKLPHDIGVESTGLVIKAMLEDVLREGAGEIVDSKEARNAISARTRLLFHGRVKKL